jgi:hypothetical protein
MVFHGKTEGHQLLQLKDRSTWITSTCKNSNPEYRIYIKSCDNMKTGHHSKGKVYYLLCSIIYYLLHITKVMK